MRSEKLWMLYWQIEVCRRDIRSFLFLENFRSSLMHASKSLVWNVYDLSDGIILSDKSLYCCNFNKIHNNLIRIKWLDLQRRLFCGKIIIYFF